MGCPEPSFLIGILNSYHIFGKNYKKLSEQSWVWVLVFIWLLMTKRRELFLGQFWLFLDYSVFIRFVELWITVAWALESPQNEFVWGSYVQNTSRPLWKSTMRFLFCSVRTYVAIFETVRVILGFWCLHEIYRASSRGRVCSWTAPQWVRMRELCSK